MLSILPAQDKEILKKCGSENATVLLCKEDEKEKGYVAFEQVGYVIHILGFEVYDAAEKPIGRDYITADAILRSLGSYAVNHSCFYIQCSKKELFPMLKNLGFAQNDNYLTINLQQLFKVCKN